MATNQDLEHIAPKEEQDVIAQQVNALNIRLEEYGKRPAFFQTFTYSFLGVLFAMMLGILVKLFLP